jgi:hypothetical protein
MRAVLNVVVVVAGGVMLADVLIHPAGTNSLFAGLGGLWKTSVNGMLGQTG